MQPILPSTVFRLQWRASWIGESALLWPDKRRDYGEQRICGLLPKGKRLYFVAFVERGESRRIISLRKANEREVQTYVENS